MKSYIFQPAGLAAYLKLMGICGLIITLASCSRGRPGWNAESLKAHQQKTAVAQAELNESRDDLLIKALEKDLEKGESPQLDILLLSGGGASGAFGSGFLASWKRNVPANHPLAYPRFDLVEGVSTGALIAPFALIGSQERLTQVDNVYRQASADWVKPSLWSLFTADQAFTDNSKLQAVLDEQADLSMAQDLVAIQDEEFRQAVLYTTDLDLARSIAFRLGDRGQLAIELGDLEYLRKPFKATAAIPGVFEPIYIDGAMHVDGFLYGQVHFLGDIAPLKRFITGWKKRHPEAPMPKVRVFVVINTLTSLEPQEVDAGWFQIMSRATGTMYKSQIVGPLNRLALYAFAAEQLGVDVEFRWIAVPPDVEIPKAKAPFDPEVTNFLSDLGAEMGQDPNVWLGIDDLGEVEENRRSNLTP